MKVIINQKYLSVIDSKVYVLVSVKGNNMIVKELDGSSIASINEKEFNSIFVENFTA